MREIESLIKRARRYLKSAEVLLKEGDFESCVSRTCYAMFYSAVISQSEAEEMLEKGKQFVETTVWHLKKEGWEV